MHIPIVRICWGAIGFLYALAFILVGDLTHFTWWSIVWTIAIATLETAQSTLNLTWFFLTTQLIVIIGVLMMSITECSLFNAAKDENGKLLYFSGNFLLHYAPCLFLFAFGTKSLQRQPVEADVTDIICALGMVLTYAMLFDPIQKYGCTIQLEMVFIGLALLITLLLVIRAVVA